MGRRTSSPSSAEAGGGGINPYIPFPFATPLTYLYANSWESNGYLEGVGLQPTTHLKYKLSGIPIMFNKTIVDFFIVLITLEKILQWKIVWYLLLKKIDIMR